MVHEPAWNFFVVAKRCRWIKTIIIQSHKHSDNAQGRARCYSSLNFTDIQKYAKNPENVYGYYVVSDEYITVMLELDKQVAEEKNAIRFVTHLIV